MRGTSRRIVAIIAAYALALQALLSVAGAVPPAALAAQGTEFALCRANTDAGTPAQPTNHESCLACLAGHCAAAGLDRVSSIVAWHARAVTAALATPHVERVTLTARPRPHGPRAPPVG